MKWTNSVQSRCDWDTFFMTQAFINSQRSIDPRTCHGACWVSEDKRILSVGYNGPVAKSDDVMLEKDLKTDLKYGLMIHAEENAILNFHGSKTDTQNSSMYITGKPCHKCLRTMIQKNIKRIVYGPVSSKCIDDFDNKIFNILLNDHLDVKMVPFNNINNVKKMLDKTEQYINYKLGM